MTDVQTFLSVDDALERILRGFTPLPARHTPLAEALGLVAAEDVLARDNVPGFDNSAYDGYAVRAADLCAGLGGHTGATASRGRNPRRTREPPYPASRRGGADHDRRAGSRRR